MFRFIWAVSIIKGKYCEVGPLFYPTEDVDADLAYIMSTYHDANPKYPENFL